MSRPHRSPPAFTLIELLTLLAIMAVLSSLLLAAFRSTRESSLVASGVNNLRQIMSATLLYANENAGRFPYPTRGPNGNFDRFFYTELTALLDQNDRTTTDNNRIAKVFRDPLAKVPRGVNHFTANGNVMWWERERRLQEFSQPSRVVVYFDGAQAHAGNVEVSGWAVDQGRLNQVRASERSAAWLDTPIDPGPNTDNAVGNIRWRVHNEKAAKFAFLDGHIQVLKPAQVTRRMFVLD